MIIYLYPEHGHERLAIDSEELERQTAWLHEQPMCDENAGIWNLLETIRDLGELQDQGPADRVKKHKIVAGQDESFQ